VHRRLTAVLVCLIAALALPSAASAFGPPFALQITGSRAPYFVLSGQPGTTLSSSVTVINVGSVSGGVTLYGTDGTTGQTSGAVYGTEQTRRTDVGAWIALSQHHLMLGPGQYATVPFQVVIPAGVRGGQHLGGIVAQPDQPIQQFGGTRGKTSFHVQVRALSVIAVQVNLPGALTQRLVITGVSSTGARGRQLLLVGIANPGTALTKGSGAITVSDGPGRRIRVPFTLDTFVPQTHIEYPVQVTGRALPAGDYRATVTVSSGGGRQSRVMPLTITQKSLEQAFGSRYTAPPPITGRSILPFIIGGLVLVVAGFSIGARARARRPAER